MNINEQIAALRRKKGLTQEELAKALDVTNQAVSKWESGQNCPDIGLLPQIADIFGVTIDTLMGHTALPESPERRSIESEKLRAHHMELLQQVRSLHHYLLSEYMKGASDRAGKEAAERARKGRWGYSCIDQPDIMTCMKGGTILFSDNRLPDPDSAQLNNILHHLRLFSDQRNLQMMLALHNLTCSDDALFVSPAAIAKKARMKEQAVLETLENLTECLREENGLFRIVGEYMHLLPILWLLGER